MPHEEMQEPHAEVETASGVADGHGDDAARGDGKRSDGGHNDAANDAARDDGGRDDGGRGGGRDDDNDAARRPLPPTELLRLQPPFEARADGRYHVSELLGFHDRPFVAAALTAALAREPAPAEVEALLAELRLGRRTKLDIVESLIDSAEGRAAGAPERIAGVGRGGFAGRLRALPLVGRLWRVVSLVARLPELARHQQQFETYAMAQIERVAEHSNHVAAQLNRVVDYANRVVDHVNRQEARVADFVNARIDEMVAHVNSAHRDTVAHAEHQRQLSADYVNEQRQRVHDYINEELRPVVADATEAVSLLSDGLAAIRADVERQQRQLNGQEEFLVQEKHEIVEAQKTALAEMEARLRSLLDARQADAERAALEARGAELETRRAEIEAWRAEIDAWRAEAEAQRQAMAELAARVEALRARFESARAAVGEEV